MMRSVLAAMLGVGLMFGAAAAQEARAQQVTASDLNAIVAAAQNVGAASLSRAPNGRPMIEGDIEGVRYVILFYGCRGVEDCTDIQFAATWNPLSGVAREAVILRANDWNNEKRFGSAFVGEDGTIFLRMETNLDYGVSRRNLEDTFDWWRIAISEFPEFMAQGL